MVLLGLRNSVTIINTNSKFYSPLKTTNGITTIICVHAMINYFNLIVLLLDEQV